MKKTVRIVVIAIFVISTGFFVSTFVRPRYAAEVVAVGRARTVTSHGKHGARRHTAVPVTVRFTDASGAEITAEARDAWPDRTLVPGDRVVVVRRLGGECVVYPDKGVRVFTGVVSGGLGLFFLFTGIERKKRLTGKEERPSDAPRERNR